MEPARPPRFSAHDIHPFNIVEDAKKFLRFIAVFLDLEKATLGSQSPDNQDSFKMIFSGTDYILQQTPFVVPAFD